MRGQTPVPVVLKFIPYRQRDGTLARDARMHAYESGHDQFILLLEAADWNDTRTVRADLDAMILSARPKTDATERLVIYRPIVEFVHEVSGLICPMFNDYINSHSNKVAGYAKDPDFDIMGDGLRPRAGSAEPWCTRSCGDGGDDFVIRHRVEP